MDSINDYYDCRIKYGRLAVTGIAENAINPLQMVQSVRYPNYRFVQMQLEDRESMQRLFAEEGFDVVVNLAAQAGVRYSITNPDVYIESNIIGFYNIRFKVNTLLLCSSSFKIKIIHTLPPIILNYS